MSTVFWISPSLILQALNCTNLNHAVKRSFFSLLSVLSYSLSGILFSGLFPRDFECHTPHLHSVEFEWTNLCFLCIHFKANLNTNVKEIQLIRVRTHSDRIRWCRVGQWCGRTQLAPWILLTRRPDWRVIWLANAAWCCVVFLWKLVLEFYKIELNAEKIVQIYNANLRKSTISRLD